MRSAQVIALILLSVALGAVPAEKSDLESRVVDQLNRKLESLGHVDTSQGSLRRPARYLTALQGLTKDLSTATVDDSDHETLSLQAIFIRYGILVILAFVADIVIASIQPRLVRDIFLRLREAGIRRCLQTSSHMNRIWQDRAGDLSMAVHQGSINAALTYNYLFDIVQYGALLAITILLVLPHSITFAVACGFVALIQAAFGLIRANRLEADRKSLDSSLNKLMAGTVDILTRREIVLAHEQQGRYERILRDHSTEYADADFRIRGGELRFTCLAALTTDIGRIAALVVSLYFAIVLGVSSVRDYGDAYFLIAVYVRILSTSSSLLSNYDAVRRAEATSQTFMDILELPRPESDDDQPGVNDEQTTTRAASLQFHKVSFRRRENRDAHEGATFTVPGGKTTLILGPSGCGKTTLLRAALGFYNEYSGTITLDGVSVRMHNPLELLARMSYIPQGDHIVMDTVRGNLGWTAPPNCLDAELLDALASVGLTERALGPNILEMDAKKLSGGQQQRLAIARMMLDRAEITLIDEPLTGVDAFTMRDILPFFTQMIARRNKTIVIVSHEIAYASFADHVVILNESAEVVQEGAPQQLIHETGIFRILHGQPKERWWPAPKWSEQENAL